MSLKRRAPWLVHLPAVWAPVSRSGRPCSLLVVACSSRPGPRTSRALRLWQRRRTVTHHDGEVAAPAASDAARALPLDVDALQLRPAANEGLLHAEGVGADVVHAFGMSGVSSGGADGLAQPAGSTLPGKRQLVERLVHQAPAHNACDGVHFVGRLRDAPQLRLRGAQRRLRRLWREARAARVEAPSARERERSHASATSQHSRHPKWLCAECRSCSAWCSRRATSVALPPACGPRTASFFSQRPAAPDGELV